jgi:RNA polymerase sigma-70 factor (ECF subfamily)
MSDKRTIWPIHLNDERSRIKGVEADDSQLVRLTISGDNKAYETLVRRYQKLVYNVLYQMVQSHEQAADLTQETFAKAFRGLKTFIIGASFKPWLLRIATNTCLNELRRKSQAVDSLESLLEEDPHAEPASRENVEAQVEMRMTQQDLLKAMTQLTPSQRQIFVLRYSYDLSYDEISQTTGLPLTTIKPILFRVREKLRKLMSIEPILQMKEKGE